MTLVETLRCRFAQLVAIYVTRVLYMVNAADVLAEINKVRRYIFFLESNCANNTDFYQELLQYVHKLTPIPSNCLNC